MCFISIFCLTIRYNLVSLVLLSPELGALRLWSFYFPPCWMDVVEVCFHQGMKCLIPDSVTCRWSFTPPRGRVPVPAQVPRFPCAMPGLELSRGTGPTHPSPKERVGNTIEPLKGIEKPLSCRLLLLWFSKQSWD